MSKREPVSKEAIIEIFDGEGLSKATPEHLIYQNLIYAIKKDETNGSRWFEDSGYPCRILAPGSGWRSGTIHLELTFQPDPSEAVEQ